jgi:hypothetical protein
MEFYVRSKLGAISMGLLLAHFWQVSIAYGNESFETDRGYREPAVVGTAIVDDSVPLAIEDEQDYQSDLKEGTSPQNQQTSDSVNLDPPPQETAYR